MKNLKTSVSDYLKLRRSLGYKLKATEQYLNELIAFLEQEGADYITTTLALQWAKLSQNASPCHSARRLSIARLFAQYRKVEDPRTEIPASTLLPYKARRRIPYIYTKEEICKVLKAAKELRSRGLRHHTYYTLFGLLVVTGCRIGELIRLDRQDVDMKHSLIKILNTKFAKSRIVPIHETTLQQLKKYTRLRDRFHKKSQSQSFFVSESGRRLTVNTTEVLFVNISKRIGLRSPSDSHGPRLHDVRHTFAVNTILRWYESKDNVDQKMPLLSVYLGHKKPTDTYWYLTGTPELMTRVASRLERRMEDRT